MKGTVWNTTLKYHSLRHLKTRLKELCKVWCRESSVTYKLVQLFSVTESKMNVYSHQVFVLYSAMVPHSCFSRCGLPCKWMLILLLEAIQWNSNAVWWWVKLLSLQSTHQLIHGTPVFLSMEGCLCFNNFFFSCPQSRHGLVESRWWAVTDNDISFKCNFLIPESQLVLHV